MTFAQMTQDQIPGAIEALLFVTDEPVNALVLADMLEVDAAVVGVALQEIQDRLISQNSGMQLRQVAGGWRLYTHPQYHELIEKYVLSWDTRKLSQAMLETLAVIAYNQPITRASIVSIRGVNSDSSISSLIEKGFVREAGREASPGQPILYATTRAFLEKFGLVSVADLPNLEDYAPDEEARTLIAQRLGVSRSQVADTVDMVLDPAEASENEDDDLTLDLSLDFSIDPMQLHAESAASQMGDAPMNSATAFDGDFSGQVIPDAVWDFERDDQEESND